MGSSCNIFIPDWVKSREIVTAVGIASGFAVTRRPLGKVGYDITGVTFRHWFGIDIPGETHDVDVKPGSDPDHSQLLISKSPVDPHRGHLGHIFRASYADRTLINGGANSYWQIIGRRLNHLFGGEVDFDDCDLIDYDLRKRCRSRINVSTDEGWYRMQHVLERFYHDVKAGRI